MGGRERLHIYTESMSCGVPLSPNEGERGTSLCFFGAGRFSMMLFVFDRE